MRDGAQCPMKGQGRHPTRADVVAPAEGALSLQSRGLSGGGGAQAPAPAARREGVGGCLEPEVSQGPSRSESVSLLPG